MRILKKIILSSLITIGSISSIQAQSIDNRQFLQQYQNIVRGILNEYKKPNLDAQIFDISNPNFLDFLQSSSAYKKVQERDIMAMQYYSTFRVRGKDTAFCFILYDSKSGLIENYIKNSELTFNETLEYLALHEMGHCLIMDYLLEQNKQIEDFRINERQAEFFALYLLYKAGKETMIDKIIEQNKLRASESIHYNYYELKGYSDKLRNNEIQEHQNFNTLIEEILELSIQ